jgi:hypothetical protein
MHRCLSWAVRFPQCRTLGEDSFHEEDYSVDCSSSTFFFTGILTLIMILCVPVGVPLGFLYAMNQQKADLGEVNTTTLGGAKLIEADADDEDDGYAFLISDYRPEYWFYVRNSHRSAQHFAAIYLRDVLHCLCLWCPGDRHIRAQTAAGRFVGRDGKRHDGTDLFLCLHRGMFPVLPLP